MNCNKKGRKIVLMKRSIQYTLGLSRNWGRVKALRYYWILAHANG